MEEGYSSEFRVEKIRKMDLLRNYQLRKQLGLIDDQSCDVNLSEIIEERLVESLRNAFPPVIVSSILNTPPVHTGGIRRHEPGSPRPKSRNHSFISESEVELRSIIDALESRVDMLESRNQHISQICEEQRAELERLRVENVAVNRERDRLESQIAGLRNMVSSESSAEKVLERVNHNNQLEFKLEIYRQQIAMLNEELNKLKKVYYIFPMLMAHVF